VYIIFWFLKAYQTLISFCFFVLTHLRSYALNTAEKQMLSEVKEPKSQGWSGFLTKKELATLFLFLNVKSARRRCYYLFFLKFICHLILL